MSGRPHVVVVGGGLAGLAASIACADGGCRVTLLEARARLGGATFSFSREGLRVDNGQHVFLRCCSSYRRFLDRIGAASKTVLQHRLAIPVLAPGGRTEWIRRDPLPAPLHLARTLLRYGFLSPSERLRAAAAAWALGRLEPGPGLDRRTFGQWLGDRRQSPAAVEGLWNLIALPTLNLPAEEASLALAVKVFRTGLLDDPGAGDVGYARVPLSDVHAEPARLVLEEAGASVRLRAAVRRIEPAPAGWEVVTDGDRLEADALILAVPHEDAARLLPPDSVRGQERLGELGASPIVNVHVVFDRPVMRHPFAAAVRSPVQWVFDRTEQGGAGGGQYLAVSVSGAEREIEERTDDLERRYLTGLRELFPPARAARVERFFVTRERAATFRQAPGTWALRPGSRTRQRGLFLAGAWTDTGWPATMEGAVRSGVTASREALVSVAATARLPAELAPAQGERLST